MHTIFADATISMSEFKKNPAAVLREAGNRPVAVLNHNKPAFYMVGPTLMEAMLEALGDRELYDLVRARMTDGAAPIEVNIDEL
ncbi:MAG TPA: type II toxin-antitoxin system Phd/YefM family antitoxin [Steroidobacteraceae bacterium]|nr:type II toxin-antitoxin system Phd/YefM family antitoxin [Steroidobacteraceae bacterium]